jgi:hypothetical protein
MQNNILLITKKGEINTLCQISKFRSPIFSYVWHYSSKLPTILIGSVQFVARNWLLDDTSKLVKLCDEVSIMLNNSVFISKNESRLTGNFFDFGSVHDTDLEHSIVTYSVYLHTCEDSTSHVLTQNCLTN